MNIVVGFSRHPGFAPGSWLLCAAEGTPYSHAYIKIRSESLDRTLIYQATGIGVYFIGEAQFLLRATPVEEYSFEISDAAKKTFLQKAIDKTGLPYSRMQVIGIGIMRLCALFGKKISNPFKNGDKAYVCCELVDAALCELGLFPDDVDKDCIGLRDLRDHVKTLHDSLVTNNNTI